MALTPLEKFALLGMVQGVELVSMMLRADTEESYSLLSGRCSKAMVLAQPSHSRECSSLHSLHIQKKNTGQGPKGSQIQSDFLLHLLFQSVTYTNLFSEKLKYCWF